MGPSYVLEGELVADRVEIDQSSRPGGLQSRLGAADVATFARAVATGEKTEQPLDARSASSQMLGCGGVSEGVAASLDQVFVVCEM